MPAVTVALIGFITGVFLPSIRGILITALLTLLVVMLLRTKIGGRILKQASYVSKLISVMPIIFLAAVTVAFMETGANATDKIKDYKDRILNATEEEKIFATHKTLDDVADAKATGDGVVEMPDEESELVRENYTMESGNDKQWSLEYE